MEITIITDENKSYFEPLMPKEQWESSDLFLGAIQDETACGILAAAEDDKVLEISYLYVAEEYRNRGIASALLESLHQIGQDSGMDGELCQFLLNDDTKELDSCLAENLYAMDDLSSTVYSVTLGELPGKYFGGQMENTGNLLLPLSKVTAKTWNLFLERIAANQQGTDTMVRLEAMSAYDPSCSFLLMEHDLPQGAILFENRGEDYLLSYFCAMGKSASMNMMALFRAGYQVLMADCSRETKIYINALTETSEKMVVQMTENRAVPSGQAVARYYIY